MTPAQDVKVNVVNMALMVVALGLAFLLPFETFLFAYAFLGPLHYLTEISWLHDRQYFSKGKYDYIMLLVIGIIITYDYFASKLGVHKTFTAYYNEFNLYGKLLSLALFSSLFFILIKNTWIKIITVFFLFAFVNKWFTPNTYAPDGRLFLKETQLTFALTSLLPTLIHVYAFTGLFMLYGALKTRSKSGLWSVVLFIACPLILIYGLPLQHWITVTDYGKTAYYAGGEGFWDLNLNLLNKFHLTDLPQLKDSVSGEPLFYINGEPAIDGKAALPIIFYSKAGILLMRFIAFAYLYHYLNWFSKTEVIKWHQVPKNRIILIILLWIIACALYLYNYATGLMFLFFLSFTHVLLEFPLNMLSVIGIGKESWTIFKKGFNSSTASKA
jgi:hypothetical protein